MTTHSSLMHGIRKDELWSCRLLFIACFAVLWPIALLARISGWRWKPWPAGPAGYKSAYREARTMAAITLGTVISI